MVWKKACTKDDLEEGEGFQMESETPVAVFIIDGEYFAIDDTCSHDESSLADGYVDGDQVECSWHFAKFCIKTGAVLSPPATRSVNTYRVKLDGDDILVDLPE